VLDELATIKSPLVVNIVADIAPAKVAAADEAEVAADDADVAAAVALVAALFALVAAAV